MLSSRQRRSDPEHFLAFTSIFKNENTYLGEWLEYHRIVGVDHFYLYDDDGSPEARELLQPYIEKGLVTRHSWTHLDGTRHDRPTPFGQRNKNHMAFGHAAQHYRNRCHWMMKIDIDEFLLPAGPEGSLVPALERLNATRIKGVMIPRYNFGDNGHRTRPKGLVCESYTRREAAPSNHKDLANARFLSNNRRCNSAHRWHHRPLKRGRLVPEGEVTEMRLNHYYTKSLEEYMARQNTSHGRLQTEERFRQRNSTNNEVEDLSMLKYVPEIAERLVKRNPGIPIGENRGDSPQSHGISP